MVQKPETTKKELLTEIERLNKKIENLTTAQSIVVDLSTNEEKYHNLLSLLPDIILVHYQGTIVFANEAAKKITGFEWEDLLNHHLFEFVNEEDLKKIEYNLNQRNKGHFIPEVYEVRINCKNNKYLDVEIRTGMIEFDKKEMTLCILTVITEKTTVEHEKRENEERYRILTENTQEFICELNENWEFLYMNSNFQKVLGYRIEDLLGTSTLALIHLKEREFIENLIIQMKKDHQRAQITFRIQNINLEWRWFESVASPFQSHSGDWKIIVVSRDVTDRMVSDEELREQHRQLLQVIDLIPHYIGVKDWNGVYVISNRHLADSFGLTVEQMIGKNILDIATDIDYARKIIDFDRQVMRSGKSLQVGETHYVDYRGIHHTVLVRKEPFFFRGRKTVLDISLDITDLKKTEEELIESQNKYKDLTDTIPQTIFEFDTTGKLIYVNKISYEQFGYTKVAFEKGINFFDLYIPEDRERLIEDTRRLLEGGTQENQEYTALRKDGTSFPVNIYAMPVKKEGKIIGMRGVIIDITQRKKSEETILKSIKLESVGILAGGIAHDFNNILTAILGNISLAKYFLKPEDRIYDMMTEAEKASLRAKNLSQQLLSLSRGGMPIKLLSYLPDLIREAADFVLHGSNASCEYYFGPDLWTAEIDQGQISQVIQNLVLNSREAMPDGGKITIQCYNFIYDGNPAYLTIPTGDYLRISIRDTGAGISKESLSRVFDPYYTTKESGHGLGLATTYSIIRNHKGIIEADSTSGRGSVFTFYLPASRKELERAEEHVNPKKLEKARLLILEDEEDIIMFLASLFRTLRYDAVFTRNGSETIKEFLRAKEDFSPYDAVILDLTIPGGMGGKETIQELLKIDSDVRAIVSSGYSNDSALADYGSFGFKGIITKPYRVDDLQETIRKVIQD